MLRTDFMVLLWKWLAVFFSISHKKIIFCSEIDFPTSKRYHMPTHTYALDSVYWYFLQRFIWLRSVNCVLWNAQPVRVHTEFQHTKNLNLNVLILCCRRRTLYRRRCRCRSRFLQFSVASETILNGKRKEKTNFIHTICKSLLNVFLPFSKCM